MLATADEDREGLVHDQSDEGRAVLRVLGGSDEVAERDAREAEALELVVAAAEPAARRRVGAALLRRAGTGAGVAGSGRERVETQGRLGRRRRGRRRLGRGRSGRGRFRGSGGRGNTATSANRVERNEDAVKCDSTWPFGVERMASMLACACPRPTAPSERPPESWSVRPSREKLPSFTLPSRSPIGSRCRCSQARSRSKSPEAAPRLKLEGVSACAGTAPSTSSPAAQAATRPQLRPPVARPSDRCRK